MIRAENLSYSFPHKELYNKISFTLEDDVHCAFIGTNGTGKSTLVNMILHPEDYLYDGKLIIDVPGRIGYVSQFYAIDEEKEVTVFDYLSEEFVRLQNKINQICEDMGTAISAGGLSRNFCMIPAMVSIPLRPGNSKLSTLFR